MIRILVMSLVLVGCGTKRVEHVETHTVSTVDTMAPNDSGALALVERVTTTTHAVTDARATTTLDTPPIIAPLLAAATGGTPWGMISGACGALLTAATGAYAAHKSAQSTAERQRADEHKADAAEGWGKAEAYALQVPPKREDNGV